MRIAIEGCLHGEVDILYNTVKYIEQQYRSKIDLVICCGDFQAVRNEADLRTMACPPKYKAMQQFWKYYKGQKRAPVLTIVIGGNHEATNHMQEMPYGGWLAENIYYLGYAGVINFGGIRIGGISGVFKGYDYNKGHFEHPPYNEDTMRSAYHTRSIDTFRMKQIKLPIDVIVSHDWPQGIYNFGDVDQLVRKKQHFKEQVEPGARQPLGSPANAEILYKCRPSYWFSAHLHVKWVALVDHDKLNEEEDELSDDSEKLNKNRYTRFLALDKALPQRDFLQIIDIPTREQKPYELSYDAEWLAILKNTNDLFSITNTSVRLPARGIDEDYDRGASQEDIEIMRADMDFDLRVPRNFKISVDIYDPKDHWKNRPVELLRNPQNTEFCEKMKLVDPFTVFKEGRDPTKPMEKENETNIWTNPNDILIDDNCEPEKNQDEIELSDDDTCLHEDTEKPMEEKVSSDDDSDDGAPQSRPFILPFLPEPKNTQKNTAASIEKNVTGHADGNELSEDREEKITTKTASVKEINIKRRNQSIYTEEPEEE